MGDTYYVDAIYKIFDKFTAMIPVNVMHMIRLGSLLIWVIAATIVVFVSWGSGAESAPQMGQKLSLSNIKEDIAREQNITKVGDVILPDLNDLIRQRHKQTQAKQPLVNRPIENPLHEVNPNIIESENPVRAYNEKDKTPMPVYQGNKLTPYVQDGYVPLKDKGVGGVRETTRKQDRAIEMFKIPEKSKENNFKNQLDQKPIIPKSKQTKTNSVLPYYTE